MKHKFYIILALSDFSFFCLKEIISLKFHLYMKYSFLLNNQFFEISYALTLKIKIN